MQPYQILIIDDEPDIIRTVRLSLEMEGYKVYSAADAPEGFEQTEKIKPHLIILDVMLPSLNGYEMCRKLKQDPKYRDIPVMLLTAYTRQDDDESIRSAGADMHITKPFDMDHLISSIQTLLKK